MSAERHLAEGERVVVSGWFGTKRKDGVVGQAWSGDGAVMVRLDGRTKLKGFPRSQVRPLVLEPRAAIIPPPLNGPRPSARVRRGAVGPALLTPQPKPKGPFRSNEYMRFVRGHRCVGCRTTPEQRPIEAHHCGGGRRGVGQKTDDTRTAPLCEDCHAHFHNTGCLPSRDAVTTRVELQAAQIDLLTEWFAERRAVEVAS